MLKQQYVFPVSSASFTSFILAGGDTFTGKVAAQKHLERSKILRKEGNTASVSAERGDTVHIPSSCGCCTVRIHREEDKQSSHQPDKNAVKRLLGHIGPLAAKLF